MPSLTSLVFGKNAFRRCTRAVFEGGIFSFRCDCQDLPELRSLHMGTDALMFNNVNTLSTLVMQSVYALPDLLTDLPKLTTVTTDENSWSFYYSRHIVLRSS